MIELVLYTVLIYLTLGVLLAVPISLWLLKKIDPITANATLGFHALALPGVVLLWPVLLIKARRA